MANHGEALPYVSDVDSSNGELADGYDLQPLESQPAEQSEVEATTPEAPIDRTQELYSAQVGAIHYGNGDYHDYAHNKRLPFEVNAPSMAGAFVSMAQVDGFEMLGLTSTSPAVVVATNAAIVGWVAGGLGHGYYGERRIMRSAGAESMRAPVIAGYALENVRVEKAEQGLENGNAVSVAVPTGTQTAASVYKVVEVAEESGADAVVIPAADLQGTPYASAVTAPLKDILAGVRPGLRTKDIAKGGELYGVLRKEDFNKVTVTYLDSVVGLLAKRFPARIAENTQLETIQDVEGLRVRLHLLALQCMRDEVGPERSWQFDAEDGSYRQQKQHRYVLSASNIDPYDPTIQTFGTETSQNITPDQMRLSSYKSPDFRIEDVIEAGEVKSDHVLPVLAHAFEVLKNQAARLESEQPEDELTSDPDTLQTVEHALEWAGYSTEKVRQYAKMLGKTVMISTMSATLFLGASKATFTPEDESKQHDTTSVGEAIVQPPHWRLEGHGMSTEGYYGTMKFYDLDNSLQWHRKDEIDEQVQAYQVPTTMPISNYVENEGYISPDELDEEGKIAVPVMYGTDVTALHVETSDGQQLPAEIEMTRDDVTRVVVPDAPDSRLHIEYAMQYDDTPSGIVNGSPTVAGVDPNKSEVEKQRDAAEKVSGGIIDTFTYDNTELVAQAVKEAESPIALNRELWQRHVANCNAANSDVIIMQQEYGGGRPLAYTTGYYIGQGEKYMATGHAWVDENGDIIDATPPLRDRTAEQAGLGGSGASMDEQWQQQSKQYEDDKPFRLPPAAPISGGLFGGLALAGAASRFRYGMQSLRAKFDGRSLTEAQAERVISHAAFGEAGAPLDVTGVTERLSVDSLPVEVVREAAENPGRVAPYLSERQQAGLRRQAERLLAEAETVIYRG